MSVRAWIVAALAAVTLAGLLMPETWPVRNVLLLPAYLLLLVIGLRLLAGILTRGYSEGRGRRW